MNLTPLISKITERGQITLPKRVRNTSVFKGARAVEFEELKNSVVIRPIKSVLPLNDHLPLLDHTMRDWANDENDNLFNID